MTYVQHCSLLGRCYSHLSQVSSDQHRRVLQQLITKAHHKILPNKQTNALRSFEDEDTSGRQTQGVRVAVTSLQCSHSLRVV